MPKILNIIRKHINISALRLLAARIARVAFVVCVTVWKLLNIRIVRILMLLCVILVLPAPPLNLNHIYKIEITAYSPGKPHKGEFVDLNNSRLISSDSILSSLTGQVFQPPVMTLCLNNKVVPAPPNFPSSATSTDSGGMSVEILDLTASTSVDLYAPDNSTKCKSFRGDDVRITNNISIKSATIRAPVILKSTGQQVATADIPYWNLATSTLAVNVEFDWKQYVKYVIITLLGVGILIQALNSVYRFIVRKL